jgi:hypothetical protein
MFSTKQKLNNAVLSAKKTRILGVFTTMQNELQQLHDEQKLYADDVKSQLKALSDELTLVENSRAETINTIKKIDNILK